MLLTFVVMEGVTWLTHRYVMHGFLWYLHEDHHQPTGHFFEKNDAFFLIFAIPSWLCIMLGLMNQVYWVVSIGAGIAMYGLAYFEAKDENSLAQQFTAFLSQNEKPSILEIFTPEKLNDQVVLDFFRKLV